MKLDTGDLQLAIRDDLGRCDPRDEAILLLVRRNGIMFAGKRIEIEELTKVLRAERARRSKQRLVGDPRLVYLAFDARTRCGAVGFVAQACCLVGLDKIAFVFGYSAPASPSTTLLVLELVADPHVAVEPVHIELRAEAAWGDECTRLPAEGSQFRLSCPR